MDGLERDTALLKAIAAHYRLTPAALSRQAKVAVTTINRPYNGTSSHRLSQPTVDKLRAAFPDFPGWAAYLHGDEDTEGAGKGYLIEDARVPYRHEQSKSDGISEDMVLVDQLDLRYGMGGTYVEGYIDVEKRAFPRDWLRMITKTPPELLSWASGIGDSMEPTIRSREVILIDRSERKPQLDDEIWAVVHGEIGMIKRLRIIPGGRVELHSDNEVVKPQTAVDGELHLVGRVIAAVRWL